MSFEQQHKFDNLINNFYALLWPKLTFFSSKKKNTFKFGSQALILCIKFSQILSLLLHFISRRKFYSLFSLKLCKMANKIFSFVSSIPEFRLRFILIQITYTIVINIYIKLTLKIYKCTVNCLRKLLPHRRKKSNKTN